MHLSCTGLETLSKPSYYSRDQCFLPVSIWNQRHRGFFVTAAYIIFNFAINFFHKTISESLDVHVRVVGVCSEEPQHKAVWSSVGLPRLVGTRQSEPLQEPQPDCLLHHQVDQGGQAALQSGPGLCGGQY